MKLTRKTIQLICDLERIVGDECYNPNSFDGWTLEEGCAFRYPVCYRNKEGGDIKTSGKIIDMDKNRINTIRYKFGSNHLYIGSAIVKILQNLEWRYGLDFDELVNKK